MLRTLDAESVHCVVTSPPYYGMRSYLPDTDPLKRFEIGMAGGEYIADLLQVFSEVKRVLRSDGTLWLNIGDVYEDGQLLGLPWMLARTLQTDGWILRQDIIWSKPSPMPESVTTRCTRSHEYVFMFTKTQHYFYDAEAIKEESDSSPSGKNRRSVWRLASTPYAGAHFATMPTTLAELCIKAGTSGRGCCDTCGSPFVRMIERQKVIRKRPNDYVKRCGEKGTGNSCSNSVAGVITSTVGWRPSCKCDEATLSSTRCTVLDPFAGSGTTLAVADSLGRDSVGVELNADYIAIAEDRISDGIRATR
jgi:DNA modification methylase